MKMVDNESYGIIYLGTEKEQQYKTGGFQKVMCANFFFKSE